MITIKRLIVGIAVMISLASTAAGSHQPLTFMERVDTQEAIERIHYAHQLWPKENQSPKPPFEDAVPRKLLEGKVADYLLKSAALDVVWHHPVASYQLQAELERMVRDTRRPDILTELFAALDNYPRLIAETLARQVLVDRLVRSWFEHDRSIHADTQRQADSARAMAGKRPWQELGGEWRMVIAEPASSRRGDVPARDSGRTPHRLLLPAEEFRRLRETTPKPGAPPHFEETPERFLLSRTLSSANEQVVVEQVVFRKLTFDEWWQVESLQLERTVPVHDSGTTGDYTLPKIGKAPGGCNEWAEPNALSVIDGRKGHTAVWTGTEMIVWGGRDNTESFVRTGGRYNPATDTWRKTSMGADCPTPRSNHTAVWTGSEMIIWGGNADPATNSGSRYSPTTDTWTPTSTDAGCPSAKSYHGAVWTGAEMIVWGGSSNTGGRYTPSTNTWAPTSTGLNCPTASDQNSLVWTGNEMIVWGGRPGPLNTGGRYSPASNSWTATSTGSNCPEARYQQVAAWTGTEMIVWGGMDYSTFRTGGRYSPASNTWLATSTGSNCPTEAARSVWSGSEMIIVGFDNIGARYSPTDDSWTPTSTIGSLPSPRDEQTAVWADTELIIWGGWDGMECFNTGGRYSPVSNTWVPTAVPEGTVPSRRANPTAIWTGTEMVVWGGVNFSDFFNTGVRWNAVTDSWTATSTGENCPFGRYWHTAVWTGNEMIVWGGWGPGLDTNTGGRYSPLTNTWTATPTGGDCAYTRASHTAVWTGTEMIVWGGLAADSYTYLNTGGRFSPASNSWVMTSTVNCPADRYAHSSIWTGAEMIIWGGFTDAAVCLNSGGRYRPDSNMWIPTPTGANCPTPRRYHSAVWTGDTMVVWGGGTDVNYYQTGGRYSPTTNGWLATTTVGSPPGLSDSRAVWTGSEMIVWGGLEQGVGDSHSGGRYDPVDDSWLTTPTGGYCPPGRQAHTAVWTGSEMIVWGGIRSGLYPYLNDGGILVVGRDPLPGTSNAVDQDSCLDSGVIVTWTKDAADWGDSEVGSRSYRVIRDGTPLGSPIAYGETTYTDTNGVNGMSYEYAVFYQNGCGFSEPSVGIAAADMVNVTPCPNVGDTLMVEKSGSDAILDWIGVTCADFSHYTVYGAGSYDAPFPVGWTVLANPTGTTLSDTIASPNIAYEVVAVDQCGNASQ